ncbi:MAG: hypothetical protein ABR962_05540 [Candidatus Bathyarchaeia archaeon]|jgi:hypothetical protein
MLEIFISVLETIASISARDVDGNGELSLQEPAVRALYHGQRHLQSLTHTLKITFDITNKRNESTLNSSPA